MGYLLLLLAVSGGIWWLIHRSMKLPSPVLCGVVVKKGFIKSEKDDSVITVKTHKDELIDVYFHTQDVCTCILLGEEQCFHGRSEEYDARISVNTSIVVETFERVGTPRTAKRLWFTAKPVHY